VLLASPTAFQLMLRGEGKDLAAVFAVFAAHAPRTLAVALADRALASVPAARVFDLPAADFVDKLVELVLNGSEEVRGCWAAADRRLTVRRRWRRCGRWARACWRCALCPR
jgi:hypothetical protein